MIELRAISPLLDFLTYVDLNNDPHVKSAGLVMEKLLLGNHPFRGIPPQAVMRDHTITALQSLYERFETGIEYDFAENILNGSETNVEQYPLHERFQRLVNAETNLAQIASSDRVLFIGSGAFPISPILISQSTGARVDCFDKSPEAIETSQGVLDKLGLSENVRVLNALGEKEGVYSYDVIVVALLAQPKESIMLNIWQHAPQDVRVVYRHAEGIKSAFYKSVIPEIFTRYRHFMMDGEHTAGPDDTISSVLLKIDRQPDKH